jgi:hypothetical protein
MGIKEEEVQIKVIGNCGEAYENWT